MEKDLRRAKGTMTEEAFNRAAARFKRMKVENLAMARAYLLPPGQLQVDIAFTNNISRQLVHKHCKKIFDAHCTIVKVAQLVRDVEKGARMPAVQGKPRTEK